MKQSPLEKRTVLERETIEIRGLQVFERVARLRSVTRAGGELGMPKSAVSKALSRLEDRLGTRLLERTSRRIELTEAGRVLLARTDSLLAELGALAEAVRDVRDEVRGTLVVAAPPDLGAHLSGGLFARFLARYPEVNVELALDYGFADLIDPAFDLAFRIGEVHDDRLVAREVGVIRRVLVASPGFAKEHALAAPRELSQAPFLIFGQGPAIASIVLTNGRREVEVVVRGRLAARSFPALLRAAEAGAGVTFLPEILARPALERGTLVRVLPRFQPAPAKILLVHRPGHQRIRRVAALIAFVAEDDGPAGIPR